jgi:hypothetical protein
MKAELRKEYEEIRSRAIQGLCVPANQVTVGTVIDAVREAVTACQELADRPPKELTDAEIESLHIKYGDDEFALDLPFVRAVIVAAHAKQREPQVVKFRAARHKTGQRIEMFSDLPNEHWEWLEPAQEFEVKLS